LTEGAIEAVSAPPHPGLLALLRAQRERRDRRYLALSRSWLAEAGSAFFQRMERFARSLSALSEPPKPRRRFVLSSVPERAKRKGPSVIRQAFLPGRRIRELVESVQSGERTRYSRVAVWDRSRSEEKISSEDFARFWSLSPHRLERARYRVRENGRTFWIDEVRDPSLVLAETEDPPDLALPEWLDSVVRREVTGSRRFDWETLARRRSDSR
jgi:CYTH domain-containing protein